MIEQFGWRDALGHDFAAHASQGRAPGRVCVQQRGLWTVVTDAGEVDARLSGSFIHEAGETDYPVVGDWVAVTGRPGEQAATIHAVLPRRTVFTRRAADSVHAPQAVAANVDAALLTTALAGDLNLRRLERYLVAARRSGADPVVVLTKADLANDAAGACAQARRIAGGAPVIAVSALTGQGLDELRAHLRPGETAAVLGSSGAGKSTLVNTLLGEDRMATGEVSGVDGRGRHTTTHRELVRAPCGALILDTPGMRELGLVDAEDAVSATFEEVEDLAARCRFRNCSHGTEPGCAVREALAEGRLDEARWRSFCKLRRELAHQERQEDRVAREAERRRWIAVSKANRARSRGRDPW